MLEFTEVFPRGAYVTNIDDIRKCGNINFSHVKWSLGIFQNHSIVCHIVDNILDINAWEYQSREHTLLDNIIRAGFSHEQIKRSVNYMMNNGYVNIDTFNVVHRLGRIYVVLNRYKNLVIYLTTISLGKFTKFYNVEKYYDTMIVMLLVLKVHKVLPKNVIRHVIIPFIYQ